jgi:uncharacterized protein YdcH (DUF465 family)
MKYIIIAALSIFSITACTSHHGATRTEEMNNDNATMKIVDDGKTMSIKVKIKNVENPVDYAEAFDIRNMSDKQKQTLKDRILDSLYKLNK